MILGSQEGSYMIQHFVKGICMMFDKKPCLPCSCLFMVSYLKTLLIPFNEMVKKFLDQIQPLADGSTAVPMKVHFGEFTQDVISKVRQAILYDLAIASIVVLVS